MLETVTTRREDIGVSHRTPLYVTAPFLRGPRAGDKLVAGRGTKEDQARRVETADQAKIRQGQASGRPASDQLGARPERQPEGPATSPARLQAGHERPHRT